MSLEKEKEKTRKRKNNTLYNRVIKVGNAVPFSETVRVHTERILVSFYKTNVS